VILAAGVLVVIMVVGGCCIYQKKCKRKHDRLQDDLGGKVSDISLLLTHSCFMGKRLSTM